MSSRSNYGIFITLFTEDEPLHFRGDQNYKAEDVCFKIARRCGIGPATRHLFALKCEGASTWLSPCHVFSLEPGQKAHYQFRLRFRVPQIKTLQVLDQNALDYYFHQTRSDFLKGLIPEALKVQEKILGLAVTDMLRFINETGTARELVEKDYRKYLPKESYNNLISSHWLRKAIHRSLVDVERNVKDVLYIKGQYITQINELSKLYGCEEYGALVDEEGQVLEVKLQVDPFEGEDAGLQIQILGSKKKKWRCICAIEELCFISMRSDSTVEISRRNGIPQYFKFHNTDDMYSFISLLDGYYRLMEKWTFNLCKDLPAPFLLNLRFLKCHGPVGRQFAYRKLLEKGRNKPGFYILREAWDYDSYRLDVCVASEENPKTFAIQHSSDGYHIRDSTDKYPTLADLLHLFIDSSQLGLLRVCIPPSEYDKSVLLLCRMVADSHPSPGSKDKTSAPVCIDSRHIKLSRQPLQPGKLVSVYAGTWHRGTGNRVSIAAKVINAQCKEEVKVEDFLKISSSCLYWQCETIVTMHGIILADPLALVMEYLPMGPLDLYLRHNRSKIQEVDLVEAATYLAKALWYLEENGVVHGSIRCRNLLMVFHGDNSFKVKLSDPILPTCSPEQIHWIPPECYHNLFTAKQSLPADTWAFGTTLWEIFSFGELPQLDVPIHEVCQLYQQGARLPQPQDCHEDVYKLMGECWAKDPDARKKPQAIIRDINQTLYEVHNSRRMHTYATIYPKDGTSLAGSTTTLSNLPTALVTSTIHLNGKQNVNASEELAKFDANGIMIMPMKRNSRQEESKRIPNGEVLEQFSQLVVSTSNASLESMVSDQSHLWIIEMSQLELHEKLGQGFYGEVHRGLLTRFSGLKKDIVAVKQLKSTCESAGYLDLQREISIMKTLQHKNIVEIKGVVEDPKTLLVMEFVPLGSMLVYIRTNKEHLKEKQLLKFSADIAEGMDYLCQKKIVHRDLAARNILVATEDTVKISDFGLAQLTGQKDYYKLKTNRDLPVRWYAPETMRYWKFSSKSDVWSFGITLWEMFSYGLEPIIENCKDDELLKTLESGKRLGCPPTCSVRIYNYLMKKCWEEEKESRPTFTNLLKEIRELHENC